MLFDIKGLNCLRGFNFDFWKAFTVQERKNFEKFTMRTIDIFLSFDIIPIDIT